LLQLRPKGRYESTTHKQFKDSSSAALSRLALGFSALANAAETFPGTEAGATSLLKGFLKPGADHAALSKQLRPTSVDYAAVFDAESSAKVAAVYDPAWEGGQMVVAPKAGQTEVKVFSATSDEMKSWSGNAAEFAGGRKDVAPKLKPSLKDLSLQIRGARQGLGNGVRRADLRQRQLAHFPEALARARQTISSRQ
jgi:hypothetical protein